MLHNPFSISVPRRSLFIAFALATFITSFASPAHAQAMTWIITIKLNNNTPILLRPTDYGLTCQSPLGALVPCRDGQTKATEITVQLGDTILWKTRGASNNTETWIVHEDAVLDDGSSGPATHHHHGHNSSAIGGATDSTATNSVTPHEYYVFVIDNATHKAYFGDPKYIIGGGIVRDCELFIQNFKNDPLAKAVVKACEDLIKDSYKSK